jgi:hypothetical protein
MAVVKNDRVTVQCLPSMGKALGTIPSSGKKKMIENTQRLKML